METFGHAIIGNGLIGSAAAKYTAVRATDVVLVGPDEPVDWKTHNGVFSSHYDSGRITRTLDTDFVWGLVAKRSIENYPQIEQASGLRFSKMVGCLKVVPDTEWGRAYIAANKEIGDKLQSDFELVSSSDLKRLFPYLNFHSSTIGIYEKSTAGLINPRTLKQAQNSIGERDGLTIIRETVIDCRRSNDGLFLLQTDVGRKLQAKKILVCAGAFSNFFNLLPSPLQVTVRAETTVLGEVSAQHELDKMPSLIYFLENNAVSSYVYLVPPVVYPDGKWKIKIGGDSERDHTFFDPDSITQWFHSPGGAATTKAFRRELEVLLPDTKFLSWDSKPCVITDTATEYPYIDQVDENIFVAAGGCGAAAKSSDELGRLAALKFARGEEDNSYPPHTFRAITTATPVDATVGKRKFHF